MTVFLIVVAVIVVWTVIAVVVGKIKDKKASERLRNGKEYELAVKIKDAVEKAGLFHFEAPKMHWDFGAYGYIHAFVWPMFCSIKFSESLPLKKMLADREGFQADAASQGAYYLDNDNIGIAVTAREKLNSQDIPESIKIAAEIIKDNGYGECNLLKHKY